MIRLEPRLASWGQAIGMCSDGIITPYLVAAHARLSIFILETITLANSEEPDVQNGGISSRFALFAKIKDI